MTATILVEDIEIPSIESLEEYRRWARSDVFPERGRFDFINDRIEVDLSPESLFHHGVVKSEIAVVVGSRIKRLRLGYLCISRMRFTAPTAGLSVQPDIALLSFDALRRERVLLLRRPNGGEENFVEIEGMPDLVVEIVSNASVARDVERLPRAYCAAGLQEFWLVDVRHGIDFRIHVRGNAAFEPVVRDADGFQYSAVLDRRYRLTRQESPAGGWLYDLQEAER